MLMMNCFVLKESLFNYEKEETLSAHTNAIILESCLWNNQLCDLLQAFYRIVPILAIFSATLCSAKRLYSGLGWKKTYLRFNNGTGKTK